MSAALATGVAPSSPARDARAQAPTKPPAEPAAARRVAVGQWTFPKRVCAAADMVPATRDAEASAAAATTGARPIPVSSAAETVPKPMPRAPSTSWATRPAAAAETTAIDTDTCGSLRFGRHQDRTGRRAVPARVRSAGSEAPATR
nr:hypothetical protein GCM10025732_14350 [Glycomyces mayteni]